MNEYGWHSILHYGEFFAWFLVCFSLMPFFEANNVPEILGNLTELQCSELIFWFMLPFGYLLFCRGIGHLVSCIVCFAVYFIQKTYLLHKLRKPERLFTGIEVDGYEQ